jgi:ABC-type uncharacterized transport system ATPase subunit
MVSYNHAGNRGGGSSVVAMKGIVKSFPRVIALDHVDFTVERGEIHALLGENGAGKTTLMSILNGIYVHDEGIVTIDGNEVDIDSPREAAKVGISMVHQHFTLIPAFTVLENMALSIPSPREPFLDMKYLRSLLAELEEKYCLEVNPDAKVSNLSVGEKQRTEIIRALSQGSKILILDEPTSVLNPLEVEKLFDVLRRISEQDTSVIFISHKLDEVLKISDQITVLKRGKVAGKLCTADATKEILATLMVGRSVLFRINPHEVELGEPLLKVSNLVVNNEEELPAVDGVSFTIRRGEILGMAGVSGNGQKELAEALLGLRKSTGGAAEMQGRDKSGYRGYFEFRGRHDT